MSREIPADENEALETDGESGDTTPYDGASFDEYAAKIMAQYEDVQVEEEEIAW